ncbi:MAG: alpha/beta fold hydrolase [Chloroflexi bacterium]|nr:alpha/beta fold hydrolase [Chloroflexota bacterium]
MVCLNMQYPPSQLSHAEELVRQLADDMDRRIVSTALGRVANVTVTPHNGSVVVAWRPPTSDGGSPITGYVVTATPGYTDRLHGPKAEVMTKDVGATTLSWDFQGLVEDCHQRYAISVAAENAAGVGPAATGTTMDGSTTFRPSGVVVPGKAPPYVVILLDGISESKPGFTMNPYHPTSGKTASYCPESWDASTHSESEADFASAPHGPKEFFSKWNFYDPKDTANKNVPEQMSNSTPRNLMTGAKTHEFMLDAIAAQGAVILPFSYGSWSEGTTGPSDGARLRGTKANPYFVFDAYTACNSNPGPVAGFGCDADPGGFPDWRGLGIPSEDFSIDDDADNLAAEVGSIRAVWGNVPIVVVGHSQGGLIAFRAWQRRILPPGIRLFSLDSPINGVCPFRIKGGKYGPVGQCVGPSGYPDYDSRVSTDAGYLTQDKAASYAFRLIGTWGDSVIITIKYPDIGPIGGGTIISGPAYGTGDETLQHELLVTGPTCADAKHNADCPDWPHSPDHISECPIPGNGWVKDDQHFIVKFCPGNIDYFNYTLGLLKMYRPADMTAATMSSFPLTAGVR